MNLGLSNSVFRDPRIILGVTVVALLGIVVFYFIYWQPERTIRRQQQALFRAVEKKSAARITRLLSKRYQDRWGSKPEQATDGMIRARGQYLAMNISSESEQISIDGREATVSTRVKVGGSSLGPGGNAVSKFVNRLEQPFVFVWQKESFLPSSWRLVSIDQSELPDNLWRTNLNLF